MRSSSIPVLSPFLLGIAMLACATPAADAQTTFRYGGDRAFAPFESLDDHGRPQGFQIDLLAAIERAGGPRAEIRLGPWPEIEADFRAGKLDAVAMTVTKSRGQWALFARSHATPATGIYHRRVDGAPVALADLGNRVIAMAQSSEPMRHTREAFLAGDAYRFLLLADERAALEAVRDGRADVAMMARAYGDALLAGGTLPGVVASEASLLLQAYGFAVAPDNQALRQRLDGALSRLEADGTLDALRARWLASDPEVSLRARLEQRLRGQYAILAVLLLLATAFGWILLRKLRRRSLRLVAERARRDEAVRAMRLAQEKYRHTFAHHPDGMLVSNGRGEVSEVNDALCRMFERTPTELVGHALRDLPFLADNAILALVRAALQAEQRFDNLPLRIGGDAESTRYYVASGRRIATGDSIQVLTVVRDVSAAMRADTALRGEFDALAASTQAQAIELDAALARARDSEAALQDFTAAVAHDLRAPIRNVSGFSALLREDLDTGETALALERTRQIDDSVARMDRMIEALTRLARSGRSALERGPIDMTAAAREAWQLIAAASPQRQVDFSIAALPLAEGDLRMVGQVWQNLLDNAWKYTARTAQARIAVDSFEEGGRSWFRVADNGAGFDMAQAQHLFQPFRRMHAGDQFAGTGVGLSIVRRIVEVHGGSIRARSSPHSGTVMEFTLARTGK